MTIRSILLGCVAWCACGSLVFGQTRDSLDRLERNLEPPLTGPANVDGAAKSGYLGMTVDLQAPDGKAVFVVAVAAGGPAEQAGVRADDVVLSINDAPIGSLQDLDRVVRQPAGTKLAVQVRRGTATQLMEITLAERPGPVDTETIGELPPPPTTGPATKSITEGRPSLGISVDDVSDLWRQRFGITTDHGAVITRIHEGSPAAKTGLPLGAVIVFVNGKRIGSSNDIIAIIQAFRPGDEVELAYYEGDRIGRKKIRLVPGDPAMPADTGSPPTPGRAVDRDDPPLRLGRRKPGSRPILDALERTLDIVLPPATERSDAGGAAGDATLTPPPPPPSAVGGGMNAPADVDELPVPPPPPPVDLDPPSGPGDPFPPAMARDRNVVPPPPPAPGKKTPVKKDPQSVLMPPAPSGNADAETDAELNALREQMKTLRDQMEELQKKIAELEKKRGG